MRLDSCPRRAARRGRRPDHATPAQPLRVASPSSAGPQWSAIDGRPLRARTSLSLRGRLWTLTYLYGTVFARLGSRRADVGRCCGGVGSVGRASTMHVATAARRVAVCSKCAVVCLYVLKIALHLVSARLKVFTFDMY